MTWKVDLNWTMRIGRWFTASLRLRVERVANTKEAAPVTERKVDWLRIVSAAVRVLGECSGDWSGAVDLVSWIGPWVGM